MVGYSQPVWVYLFEKESEEYIWWDAGISGWYYVPALSGPPVYIFETRNGNLVDFTPQLGDDCRFGGKWEAPYWSSERKEVSREELKRRYAGMSSLKAQPRTSQGDAANLSLADALCSD
jgi:hypothetical protein